MMKNILKKLISFLLVTVILTSGMPAIFAVDAGERADYSVSPSYAARYPNGVFEFTQAEAETCEGGSVHFKLIREGGTTGRVTLEIKAVDITAKYGVDYYVKAGGKKLVLDDEYSGTLTENYLDEIGFDYVTSDDITKDEEYKRIIGYKDTKLDDETTAELYGASVGLVSDTLKISSEEAQKLLRVTEPDDETEPVKSEAEKAYASKLHEQHDAILGGKSAANHMNDTDLIDEDALFGSNDKNLAASEIYAAAVGASLVLTFEEGENEKEIVVVSIGDKEHEPQEIASLGICNPTGGAEIGALLNVAIKINDDDKATETSVGFEAPSVKVGSNENAAAVDIVRSGSLNDYAVVRVNTKSVSAEQGTDYLPVSASSVFLPGEQKKTVIVPLKTCLSDQTMTKTFDIELSCETPGVDTEITTATVEIEPRLAAGPQDEGGDDNYVLFTKDFISEWRKGYSDTMTAYLFSKSIGEYSSRKTKRIEIDFTYTEPTGKTPSGIKDKPRGVYAFIENKIVSNSIELSYDGRNWVAKGTLVIDFGEKTGYRFAIMVHTDTEKDAPSSDYILDWEKIENNVTFDEIRLYERENAGDDTESEADYIVCPLERMESWETGDYYTANLLWGEEGEYYIPDFYKIEVDFAYSVNPDNYERIPHDASGYISAHYRGRAVSDRVKLTPDGYEFTAEDTLVIDFEDEIGGPVSIMVQIERSMWSGEVEEYELTWNQFKSSFTVKEIRLFKRQEADNEDEPQNDGDYIIYPLERIENSRRDNGLTTYLFWGEKEEFYLRDFYRCEVDFSYSETSQWNEGIPNDHRRFLYAFYEKNAVSNTIEAESNGKTWRANGTLVIECPDFSVGAFSIKVHTDGNWAGTTESEYELVWGMFEDEFQISEIRLYRRKHKAVCVEDESLPDEEQRTAHLTASYRVFDGLTEDKIIDTKEFDVGTVTVEPEFYMGYTVGVENVNLSEEARKRDGKFFGYDYDVKIKDDEYWNQETGGAVRLSDIQLGTEIGYEPFKEAFDVSLNIERLYVLAHPIVRFEPMEYITVGEFSRDEGSIVIDGREYCDELVCSDAWREGDELVLYARAKHGYICNQIEITRADGQVEYIKSGEKTILTKGMVVKPVLVQENIKATVCWKGILPGSINEEESVNFAHNYRVVSTHVEVQTDDNGNEVTVPLYNYNEATHELTFENLAHGDTVTLYAVPNDDATEKCTGLWVRDVVTSKDEDAKYKYNDTRFMICVGDGYTFTVDDHDMRFYYYFVPNEPGGDSTGTVVEGQIFSPGGTVKVHNDVELTAENVADYGVRVANASVSVCALGETSTVVKDGKQYFTSSVTDKDGRFYIYVPGGQDGYGYSLTINDNGRVYNFISVFSSLGKVQLILPFQNTDYQVVEMTLGQDQTGTEISVGDIQYAIGVKIAVSDDCVAEGLIFRSYNKDGTLLKEWYASEGENGWDYQTNINAKDYFEAGGRLTVEIVGQNGQWQGEVDSGYSMVVAPMPARFMLPSYEPYQSVTLPVFGEYSASFDLGSASSVEPEKSAPDTSTTAAAQEEYTIKYGAGGALKDALKKAKQDEDYASLDAQARASRILGYVSVGTDDMDNVKEFTSKQSAGKGKSAINFYYKLGVFMLMHTTTEGIFFDDLVLFATAAATAEATKEFTIAGVPVYIKFSGELDGQILIHVDNYTGQTLAINTQEYYFNTDMLDNLQSAGAFNITVSVTLGAGVGNPKYLSAGVSGTITMVMDFQPWSEAAGIVDLSLDCEFKVLGYGVSYNIAEASYGMFRTDNYTGYLDFSNVSNSDKFQSNKKLLRSYDDGKTVTEIYGEIIKGRRGSSVMDADEMAPDNTEDRIVAAKSLQNAANDMNPVLMPIKNGDAVLYLRLADDSARGDNDYSSVVYSIIDYNGVETVPRYLDDDGTFDSKLTAAEIGGGRILVVWRDHTKAFGDEDADLGEMLNHTDLSYCIFNSDGEHGEVRKLTDADGAAGLPTIAYDEQTGKTVVVYSSTDYQTEGVTFGEDNIGELGNFLYNSYSTICFKVLDENGDIIEEYTENESNYAEYEAANGSLGGMRYLNTQLDNSVSQAAIDEIAAEARDGKLYVVYSLDTDSSIHTTADRELFATVVDLSTMEQSAPERLTNNNVTDSNPQIVEYNGDVQLYWNHDGVITLANLVRFFEYRGQKRDEYYVNSVARKIENASNAATSFHVRVLPNGKLILVWSGWKTVEDGRRVTIYYKEYDPKYVVGKYGENNPVYGSWGNAQSLITLGERQDTTEFSFIYNGMRAVIAYKSVNRDQNSADSAHVRVLRKITSVDTAIEFTDKYPRPGQKTTLKVTATNTGSLPSENVTVEAYLVDREGNRTLIGTKLFKEHYQSNGKVTAVFTNFVMPENPEEYKILVLASEKDVEEFPFVKQFDLPFDSAVSFESVAVKRAGDKYALTVKVKNEGNRDFDGAITLDYIEKDHKIFEDSDIFTQVTENEPIAVGAKKTVRKIIYFDVDEEHLNVEDDTCKLYLTVVNGENRMLDSRTFFVEKYYSKMPDVKDVWFDGSEQIPELQITEGEAASLNALIMPYKARIGYHLEYSIDDPTVAEVDEQGNVIALKDGNAQITVSVVKDALALTVNADHRANASINEFGIMELNSSEEETVMTKTVSVSVLSAGQVNPPTGDSANLFLWIALTAISLCGIIAVIPFGKNKKSYKVTVLYVKH